MTFDGLTIVFALVAFTCYVLLVYRRVHDDHSGSRFLFIDLILAIAALEIIADEVGWHELAWLTQGAVMAGGVALLATYHKG